MPKNLVVKDNALINASYNLDLIEQRIILLAVAQSRKKGVNLASNRKVVIHISDYIDIYKIQGKSVYENIKEACSTLFERQFTYMEKQDKGVRIAKSRWVSEVAYNDETCTIDVTFSDTIVPLLSMLEKHFTSYELEEVADLNSKYSVRLYEILIAWRSVGKTPMIELDEIRYRLGVSENEYKTMEAFKRRVLDLAVNEISTKTDIQISYEQHRQGRKIIGFSFDLKKKKQNKTATNTKKAKQADILTAETPKEPEPYEINPIFKDILIYVSVSEQKNYLKMYSEAEIQAIIERADEYLNDLQKQGKKPSKGAVYKKAFLENWGKEKLLEKQEAERKKEAARQARQKELEAQKLADERFQRSKERRLEAIAIFEELPTDEQEEILNIIEQKLSSFFRAKFIEKRRKGEPVYLDALANIELQKILFD